MTHQVAPSAKFGPYGGQFVPETLMRAFVGAVRENEA